MSENPGEIIYLNNAATSFPKPPGVIEAVERAMRLAAGSPGRAGYATSLGAEREVFHAREALSRLLGVSDSSHLIFTHNATAALNLVLRGLLEPGDHVVTTSMEHNSVARPLHFLANNGVEFTRVPCSPDGRLDPRHVQAAIRPQTRLVVMVHASNVTGSILPVEVVARMARERGIPLLLDAAQTGGVLPMNLEALGADYVAFAGHKGLLGPQGTGILYVRDASQIAPLCMGGTGSQSDRAEQPEFLPDKFESGTPNVPGLAGLAAAAEFLLERGVDTVRAHESALLSTLLHGLRDIPRMTIYGACDPDLQVGVVSVNIADLDPGEVAQRLEAHFGILTRSGLHCAPWAHETIGTLNRGTLRLSLSWATTESEIERVLRALHKIAQDA